MFQIFLTSTFAHPYKPFFFSRYRLHDHLCFLVMLTCPWTSYRSRAHIHTTATTTVPYRVKETMFLASRSNFLCCLMSVLMIDQVMWSDAHETVMFLLYLTMFLMRVLDVSYAMCVQCGSDIAVYSNVHFWLLRCIIKCIFLYLLFIGMYIMKKCSGVFVMNRLSELKWA